MTSSTGWGSVTGGAVAHATINASLRTPFAHDPLTLVEDETRRLQARDGSHTHELFVDGEPVRLTAPEYRLLEYLGRRAGGVVRRRDISRHMWDESYDPLTNVMDACSACGGT
jgi:DNA-binding response OmpR family regulator